MLKVDLCVIFINMNLDQSALYVIAEITELEIPLHVKLIKQSGENSPSITIVKLSQVYEECCEGLENLNPLGSTKERTKHTAS